MVHFLKEKVELYIDLEKGRLVWLGTLARLGVSFFLFALTIN